MASYQAEGRMAMEDEEILSLYRQRDETAIAATAEKFGGYCAAVAGNVLDLPEDVAEVLNDTWLRAWDSIPPQSPAHLKLYLARLTRNLAFDRFRRQHREKRGGGELALALEELSHCVPAPGRVEDSLDGKELEALINRFLAALPGGERRVFVRRYFAVEDMVCIAARYGMTQAGVRASLYRTRKKLKRYLEQEGYIL